VGTIIDSSVLIEAERGRIDLDRRLADLGAEPVAISAVTASELLHGVERADGPARRRRREQFVEWVLDALPVAEFGLAEARIHAVIWAQLQFRGTPIGAHDLLIAATALSLGFRLATGNAREFGVVPGLSVDVWTA